MSRLPHTVTVKNGEATFECPWLYGECHFYPTCDCESWDGFHFKDYGPGHEPIHHIECWMKPWFDNEGASYTGEDFDDMEDNQIPRDMNRSGIVDVTFMYEWIEWSFK